MDQICGSALGCAAAIGVFQAQRVNWQVLSSYGILTLGNISSRPSPNCKILWTRTLGWLNLELVFFAVCRHAVRNQIFASDRHQFAHAGF
jgi:hypothetical protein